MGTGKCARCGGIDITCKKFGFGDVWLHLPQFMRYPDRYHARSIKLVD